MVSIKDKIAKMIALANGEVVRHCHALLCGDIGRGRQVLFKTKKAPEC